MITDSDIREIADADKLASERRCDLAAFKLEPIAARNPDYAPVRMALGRCLGQIGRHGEALEHALAALAISPANPSVQWNASMLLFKDGRWGEAWPLLSASAYRVGMMKIRCAEFPARWIGDIQGKCLVWCDQGRGDFLASIRFAIALHDMGRDIVLECPPSMLSLLQAQEYPFEVIERPDDFSIPPGIDCNVNISELPGFLEARPGGVPGPATCIKSEAMPGLAPGAKVGVLLEGNRDMVMDWLRTPPIDVGRAILAGIEPLARIYLLTDLSIWRHGDPVLQTYADTAAMIAAVDLVLTTDTSVAHLAGCMGKRTILLLSAYPDWRFGYEGKEIGWYDNMRFVRQSKIGEWRDVVAPVINAVREELALAANAAGV